MKDKNIYFDIYSEFNDVNKFRELKSVPHHGTNRLNHINRVAKLSFFVAKKFKLDYISCTRGAIMHDFFTTEDLSRNDKKFNKYLKEHPLIALNNSKHYFEVNDLEKEIILSHMYPITIKQKPVSKEAKIVCILDKLVSAYEFFKYQLKLSFNIVMIFLINIKF